MEEKTPEKQSEGKFNIAVSYLLSINDILREIKDISLKTSIRVVEHPNFLSVGEGQRLKYKLLRNLYVQAMPLVKGKKGNDMDKIWKMIKNVKLHRIDINKKKDGYDPFWVDVYTKDVENELDELILAIQVQLQNNKYFMPLKSDSDLF